MHERESARPTIWQRIAYHARHRRSTAARWASRTLFHNTIGVANNLKGPLSEGLARLAAPSIGRSDDSVAARLREDGIAVMDTVHDRGLIETIAKRTDLLIEDRSHSQSRSPSGLPESYSLRLNDPLRAIPEARELLSPDVVEMLSSYYGAHIRVLGVQIFRNKHVPADILAQRDVLSDRWHFDHAPTDYCDYWIPLMDITSEDGPTYVLPIARSAELIKMGFGSRSSYGLPIDVIENPAYLRRLTGPAGSKIFHRHPLTLHRASIPAPGRHRDVVLFNLAVARKPLAEDWASRI